jgi:hypothetical protein
MNGRSSLLLAVLALPLSLGAANPFFVTYPVQAPAAAVGLEAQAAMAAGATILRDQVPGEPAFQMAGPDGPGLGRIFTRPGLGSYVLTDAGSQWATGPGNGQTVLALAETTAGQFGWTGKAYAGAVQGTLSKADLVAGRKTLPLVLMSEIPTPLLADAGDHFISLTVPALVDTSGLASGMVLWRQAQGGGWQKLVDLAVLGSQTLYTDTTVASGQDYQYGVSLRYPWPGGSQAGALPAEADSYVTLARSQSSWIWASKIQPTPTPFPTIPAVQATPDLGAESWLAYPNPNRDGMVRLAFHMVKKGSYRARFYSLDGTLVFTLSGEAGADSWPIPVADLSKKASGIYLVDLRITYEGESELSQPIRKLALVR